MDVPPPPEADSSTTCCPNPFCEDGLKSKDECHKIALESRCLEPPQDKTKCVGFNDPFGCCTKFQCAEGKYFDFKYYDIPKNLPRTYNIKRELRWQEKLIVG